MWPMPVSFPPAHPPPSAFVLYQPIGIVSGVGGLFLFLVIEQIVVAVPVFVIVECGLFFFALLSPHVTASLPAGWQQYSTASTCLQKVFIFIFQNSSEIGSQFSYE